MLGWLPLLCLVKVGQFPNSSFTGKKISQIFWVWHPKGNAVLCGSQRLTTSAPNKVIETKITMEDPKLAVQELGKSLPF